jgi:broad specificity phosphatase PhoE
MTDDKGPDPLLTHFGKEQVTKTANAWKEQIKFHVPLPEALYTSPLRRAIDTAGITWDGIELPEGCDRRVCLCGTVGKEGDGSPLTGRSKRI